MSRRRQIILDWDPAYKRQGFGAAMKRGVKLAADAHQHNFLPKHFTTEAYARYPIYEPRLGKKSGANVSYYESAADAATGRDLRRPLYWSGRTMEMVTGGEVKITGRKGVFAMKINVPDYITRFSKSAGKRRQFEGSVEALKAMWAFQYAQNQAKYPKGHKKRWNGTLENYLNYMLNIKNAVYSVKVYDYRGELEAMHPSETEQFARIVEASLQEWLRAKTPRRVASARSAEAFSPVALALAGEAESWESAA